MATISADPTCHLTESSKTTKVRPVDDEPTFSPLVDADINKIVERKLRSSNFRVLHWSLDSLGETNGFLGQYHTLSVTVRIDDESTHLKFFAKTLPPPTSPQYDFLVRFNTFDKEIVVYSEVFPRMGIGNGPKWLPDYYLGKSNSIIVLEDAKQSGYVMPDKYVPFDEEHCIAVVRTLSTFHSRSLILDEKLRRSTGQTILDLYEHILEEVAFVENELAAEKYLFSCVKGACTMVDLIEGLNGQERIAMKDWIAENIKMLPRFLVSSKRFRNLVCHRDVWANNIMFKRDSEGKPIGCYLVDFQFLRYSPPALDFMIFLHVTTDRATRRRCFDRFVDIYCDTMRQQLAEEGLDMEECLPREQFVESCRELKNTALAYSIANSQIMLLTKDAVEKYFIGSTDLLEHYVYGEKRSELVVNQCRSTKLYKPRIVELLMEMKEHIDDKQSKC